MEFVERSISSDNPDGSERPGKARSMAASTDGAEYQKAENEIFGEMRTLANVMVNPEEDGVRSLWQEPVQDWNEDRCRVVRRERFR